MSTVPKNVWQKIKPHHFRGYSTACKSNIGKLTYRKLAFIRSIAAHATSAFQGSRQCSSCGPAQGLTDNQTAENVEKETDLALFPNPSESNMFVPKCEPARIEDVKRLQEFVNHSKRLLVMTGT